MVEKLQAGRPERFKRDFIISNYIADAPLYEFFSEITRYFDDVLSPPSKSLTETKERVFMQLKDSPSLHYDILTSLWGTHNSLSLTEIGACKMLEHLISNPEGVKLLAETIMTHDVLDKAINLISAQNVTIALDYKIQKLKEEFSLTKDEVDALSSPLADSFFIKRVLRLNQLAAYRRITSRDAVAMVEETAKELYGDSVLLLKRDLEKHSNKPRVELATDLEEMAFKRRLLFHEKAKLARKIGDVVWDINKLLELDNLHEKVYLHGGLVGIEDYHLRKLLLNASGRSGIENVYIILDEKSDEMKSKLNFEIAEYPQRYMCFSAALINALSHFYSDIGPLGGLEKSITEKTIASPYVFTLLPKLALYGMKEWNLDVTLYQSSDKLPGYEEAKKEFDKWGMQNMWLFKGFGSKGIKFDEEPITMANYELIKSEYERSLKEGLSSGMKFELISKPTTEMLINDLSRGRLSVWAIMAGDVGHSSLLHGYNNKLKILHFFDPIMGNVSVKYDEVADYLKTPSEPVYSGISVIPKDLTNLKSKLAGDLKSSTEALSMTEKRLNIKI